MSKSHIYFWLLGIGAVVMLWVGRQARIKSLEVRQRTQRREQEVLAEFPELAEALRLENQKWPRKSGQ